MVNCAAVETGVCDEHCVRNHHKDDCASITCKRKTAECTTSLRYNNSRLDLECGHSLKFSGLLSDDFCHMSGKRGIKVTCGSCGPELPIKIWVDEKSILCSGGQEVVADCSCSTCFDSATRCCDRTHCSCKAFETTTIYDFTSDKTPERSTFYDFTRDKNPETSIAPQTETLPTGNNSSTSIGVVLGGVLGGLLIVGLIIMMIWIKYRRPSKAVITTKHKSTISINDSDQKITNPNYTMSWSQVNSAYDHPVGQNYSDRGFTNDADNASMGKREYEEINTVENKEMLQKQTLCEERSDYNTLNQGSREKSTTVNEDYHHAKILEKTCYSEGNLESYDHLRTPNEKTRVHPNEDYDHC